MKTKETQKYAHWLHVGLYGSLQRATVILFGMGSTMILAHKAIEPAEMGVWSLFLIIAAFVEIVRHGLVKNSVVKYLNSHPDTETAEILSAALFLNAFITLSLAAVLTAGAGTIAHYLKAPPLEGMLYWYGLALLALIPFSQLEWIMLARSRFKQLFWSYVVRQGVILFLQLGCVLIRYPVSLNLLVLFYAAGILCGAAGAYWFNRSLLSVRFSMSLNWIKRLWHYGKFSFATGLSNLVFRSTDSFMVSNLLASTFIVAEQGISLRVFNLIDIPSQLVGDMLFPRSASLEPDNRQRIKLFYEKSVGATLSVVLPAVLFVFLFPELPVLILAGPKYLGAIPYLKWLMIISIFLCFLKQFGTIIDSIGHPQVNFKLTTGIALLNLPLCYFFIQRFGFIGAAYGLMATHMLAFAVTQAILFKRYQILFLNSFRYAVAFYPELARMLYSKMFTK